VFLSKQSPVPKVSTSVRVHDRFVTHLLHTILFIALLAVIENGSVR